MKFGLLLVPLVSGDMPGSRRRTSAADVPTIGMFSICSAVRVALFSPELSGVRATSALTETVSATVATLRAIWRSERLSPDRSSMPVTSYVLKPAIETWTV